MLSINFSDSRGKPYTIDPRKSIVFAYRGAGSTARRPFSGDFTDICHINTVTAARLTCQTQPVSSRHSCVKRQHHVSTVSCRTCLLSVVSSLMCHVSQCRLCLISVGCVCVQVSYVDRCLMSVSCGPCPHVCVLMSVGVYMSSCLCLCRLGYGYSIVSCECP
jgi:hypothetical protein